MYKVDKNKEKPKHKGRRIYPFHIMEVGDSFDVSILDDSRGLNQKIQGAASSYRAYHNKKFKLECHKIKGGILRCWRVQ